MCGNHRMRVEASQREAGIFRDVSERGVLNEARVLLWLVRQRAKE